MVGGQADVKLVSNAMANATRRKIMAMLVESNRSREEIEKAAGASMLDYHLQMMQQAGLIEQKDGTVTITEFGKNFMQSKTEKPVEVKKDLAGTKPIKITEIMQLLPCIADTTKFRIIARVSPPLGGALKLLEPLFPRARYSDKIGGAHHPEKQYHDHRLLDGKRHHDHDPKRAGGERCPGRPEKHHQQRHRQGHHSRTP